MSEEIYILINGKKYSGWESISFSRSISALCGSFSIQTINRWKPDTESWPIHEQDAVKIKIGNDLICSGYVDSTAPDIKDSGVDITIEGRDKTCDLVDCSATNTPGSWKRSTFKNIMSDLVAKFGLNILYETTIPPDKFSFELQNQETVFAAMNRLCKKFNVIPTTNGFGEVVIINSGSGRADVILEYGKNIKSASGKFDFTNRYSEYFMKGQESGDGKSPWKNSVGKTYNSSNDSEVLRYRPLIIQAEGAASNAMLKRRADFELTDRKAKGFGISVTLAGWRQNIDSGRLWTINEICKIKIPLLEINEDLLIDTVEFTKSESGSESKLKLVPTESYAVNPISKTKRKKGIAWI